MSKRQDLWKYLRAKVKKAKSNSSVADTSKCVGGSDLPQEHGDVTTCTQRRGHTCHCTQNSVALRHFRSSGMDETAHIRANGPRAVIQELFATYGGKMSSSQAARHSKTSETAKRAQKHIHTCSDNVA
jgi:hypothetical protein